MGDPLVSVVMSTFNDADALPDSVESVIGQGYRDFEFIIVNDGSTDERVADLLRDYAGADPRIQVMTQPNAGLTAALIAACDRARGDFIARIDAGDRMLEGRLGRQAEVLSRHAETSLVSCWTEYCGPEWEPMFVVRGVATPEGGMRAVSANPREGLRFGPTHHGSVMFRRSSYRDAGGYRAQFYYGQDWDLWSRLAEQGAFAVLPEVLYRARVFPASVSAINAASQFAISRHALEASRLRREGRDEAPALAMAARLRPGAGRPASVSSYRRAGGWYFIGRALVLKGDSRGDRYLRQALRTCPYHLRSWVVMAVRAIQRLFIRGMPRPASSSDRPDGAGGLGRNDANPVRG